jgi:hypothetical protein
MYLSQNILSSICKYLPIEDIAKLHKITKFNPNLQIFREKKYFKIRDIRYLPEILKNLPVKFFVGDRCRRENILINNDNIISKLMEVGKTLFIICNPEHHIYEHHNNIWETIMTDKIQWCDIVILHKTNIFRLLYNINHKCMNGGNTRPRQGYRIDPEKDWFYIKNNLNDRELNIIFEFTYDMDHFLTGRISFQHGFLIIGNSLNQDESWNAIHCHNYIKIDKNKEFVQDFVDIMVDVIDSKKILDTLNNANR